MKKVLSLILLSLTSLTFAGPIKVKDCKKNEDIIHQRIQRMIDIKELRYEDAKTLFDMYSTICNNWINSGEDKKILKKEMKLTTRNHCGEDSAMLKQYFSTYLDDETVDQIIERTNILCELNVRNRNPNLIYIMAKGVFFENVGLVD